MVAQGSEVCGDRPLSQRERACYVLYGFRQIRESMSGREGAMKLRVNPRVEEIRRKISEGASPLRVYTTALTREVLAEHPNVEGTVCDIGCGSGGHRVFFESRAGRL